MHEITPRSALTLWPPDDTEESVLGTDLHQGTITDARTGINEAALAAAPPGAPAPFQASSQTLITGMRRPDGVPYKVLPDVFVYRGRFDRLRMSLELRRDGPPALTIEVLSRDTWETDVDIEAGKGWTYADAAVDEYLILDPVGQYMGAGLAAGGGRVRALGSERAGTMGKQAGFRGHGTGGVRGGRAAYPWRGAHPA